MTDAVNVLHADNTVAATEGEGETDATEEADAAEVAETDAIDVAEAEAAEVVEAEEEAEADAADVAEGDTLAGDGELDGDSVLVPVTAGPVPSVPVTSAKPMHPVSSCDKKWQWIT